MSTIVSVHADPDDEALLTGGWLTQRAAAGDRVVLVFAPDGDAGLAGANYHPGGPRAGTAPRGDGLRESTRTGTHQLARLRGLRHGGRVHDRPWPTGRRTGRARGPSSHGDP